MAELGTFVQGQVLTSAELNAIGDLTTFTPSWTGNVTVGNATRNVGRYYRFNDLLYVQAEFTCGSTSSFQPNVTMTVPGGFSLVGYQASDYIGNGCFSDAAVATYPATVIYISATSVSMYVSNAAGTYASLSTGPALGAGNDFFNLQFWARIA